MKFNIYSIKWKLLAICILLVTLPTIILGVLSYNTFKTNAYQEIETYLSRISIDWQIMTRAHIEHLERVLKREEVLVRQRLTSVALDVTTMLSFAAGQYPQGLPPDKRDALMDQLAQIRIGRNGYVYLMDTMGQLWRSKEGRPDGNNFFSYLPLKGDHPQFYEGLSVDKETKIVHYTWKEPSKGENEVMAALIYFKPWNLYVGACIYRTDYKSYELKRIVQEELRYKIAAQRIGTNGYIWVINSKGEYVVSRDRFRDGENIIDSREVDGTFIIKEIINKAHGLAAGETYTRQYGWKHLGDDRLENKMAVFTYVPEWDWIIGANSYQKDYLKGLVKIRNYILMICAVAVVLGSFVGYLLALFISRPISDLERISKAAALGNLDIPVEDRIVRQLDEVGSLTQSFYRMMRSLKELIEDKEVASQVLMIKNKELAKAKGELEHTIVKANALARQREKLIHELQNALSEVKTLRGILPICSHCKKIRDDKGYWNQIESYIHKHSDVDFSHGICPECAEKYYSEMKLYGDEQNQE